MNRTCGSCTKCCEGWLAADVHGHFMEPGTHCHFLKESKCSIYPSRPNVCKDFFCAWLMDERIDDDLKPDNIHQIITYNYVDDIGWYEIVEAGEKIKKEHLKRIIDFVKKHRLNLRYKQGTDILYINVLFGTDEFKERYEELANK